MGELQVGPPVQGSELEQAPVQPGDDEVPISSLLPVLLSPASLLFVVLASVDLSWFGGTRGDQ